MKKPEPYAAQTSAPNKIKAVSGEKMREPSAKGAPFVKDFKDSAKPAKKK